MDDVSGLAHAGEYGFVAHFHDVERNELIENARRESSAELIPLFFHLFAPHERTTAWLFLQRFRSHGMKSIFWPYFYAFFRERHPNYRIRINRYVTDTAIDQLIRSEPLKIRFQRLQGSPDKAETLYRNDVEDVREEISNHQ